MNCFLFSVTVIVNNRREIKLVYSVCSNYNMQESMGIVFGYNSVLILYSEVTIFLSLMHFTR